MVTKCLFDEMNDIKMTQMIFLAVQNMIVFEIGVN